ncbi:MAG: hypothetical protein D6796_08510 [Caldilineae bacterium]|nr:MAG: hypothetical protein D6796_08510 [Caldilineae bacterium]
MNALFFVIRVVERYQNLLEFYRLLLDQANEIFDNIIGEEGRILDPNIEEHFEIDTRINDWMIQWMFLRKKPDPAYDIQSKIREIFTASPATPSGHSEYDGLVDMVIDMVAESLADE